MLRPFAKDLFYPAVDNFAGIPAEIIQSFKTCSSAKKIIFLLIDAFGFDQMERQRDRCPHFKELCERSKLKLTTSQFPSTTTAHVTTAFFNVPVGQHGLYEWQIYEPLCDEIFITLPYLNIYTENLPKVEELLPYQTIFEQLSNYAVDSTIVSPREYLRSPYNQVAARGAAYAGYSRSSWEDVLASAIAQMPERSYLYFYYPYIDAAGHNFGPESKEVNDEVSALFSGLTKILLEPRNCEWLLTADHGMVSVDPKNTIRLDRECPWLLPTLRKNSSGRAIAPAGSERDLFIHTLEPEMVRDKLSLHLGERAEVRTTAELIELGFFGKNVSQRLLDRIGDLVVLPIEGESVWMLEEISRLGQHGGLTKREIEIGLLKSM